MACVSIIQRLGRDKIFRDTPQQDCFLVQSMIPEIKSIPSAQEWFETRAKDLFEEYYYREDPEEPEEQEEGYRYLSDNGDDKAPHHPVCITYSSGLAFFKSLPDIIPDIQKNKDFQALVQRIYDFFYPDS